MKLQTCLEIGNECGLGTVGESIYYVDLRAGQIFSYCEINKELQELVDETKELFSKTNFTAESEAEDVLNYLLIEDDGFDTSELNL